MCVVEAVGNIQGASTRAEKRTARNGCATYPALRTGLKSSASLWDLRGENTARVVSRRLSTCVCALWRQWGTFKGLPPGRKNAQPGMAVPRTQHFMLG